MHSGNRKLNLGQLPPKSRASSPCSYEHGFAPITCCQCREQNECVRSQPAALTTDRLTWHLTAMLASVRLEESCGED